MRKVIIFLITLISFLQISAQNPDYLEYINTYKDVAIREMQKYGIPASITLAQGILESGAGKGRLATKAKNHFGIKCHKEWTGPTIYHDDDKKGECFRKYNDPLYSFEDHSKFLKERSRYNFLFQFETTDYKSWAFGLKQAGYATDPKYPAKLIKLIEEYELNKYDLIEEVVEIEYKEEVQDTREEVVERKEDNSPSFFKKLFSNSKRNIDDEKVFNDGEYIADINPYRTHKVEKINNVKCVIAVKGDTYASIADEFDLYEKEVLKANEVKYGTVLKPGQIVFLAKKKRKGLKVSYMFREGDTMYSVSQLQGIRLRSLYKLNNIVFGKEPEVGVMLKLR